MDSSPSAQNEPISSRGDQASATHELADAIQSKMNEIKIESSSSEVNDSKLKLKPTSTNSPSQNH